MASILGDLLIRLGLDASSLTAALASVNKELDKVSRDTARSFSGIQKSAEAFRNVGASMTVGLTLPIVGLGSAALKSAGEMEALKLALTAVAGSAEAAEKQFADLREVAKLPGLGLQDAVRGAVNLQNVGFTAEKSKKILLEFGNALASVGRGREDLGELIRQFGQLQVAFNATNIRPIVERIPQAAAILRREFGPGFLADPANEFKKLGITTQEFTDIFLRELGKLPRVAGGVKNDLENMADAIDIAMAKVGKSLIPITKDLIDVAVPAVEKFADAFAKLSPEMQKAIIIGAGLTAVFGPVLVLFGQMIISLGQFRLAWVAALAVLDKVATATSGTRLGVLGMTGAVIAAVYEVGRLVKALWDWYDAEQQVKQAQEGRQETNNELARRILQSTRATKEQRAEVVRLNEDLAAGRIDQEWYGEGLRAIAKAIGDTIPKQRQAGEGLKNYGELSKEAAKAIDELNEAEEKRAEALSENLKNSKSFVDTFRLLAAVQGPLTEEQYKLAKSIDDQAEAIKKAEEATKKYFSAVESATFAKWRKESEKQIEITREQTTLEREAERAVRERTLEQVRGAQDVKRAQEQLGAVVKDSAKAQKKSIQEVSTVINDMVRETARAIVHWEGLGEAAKRIGLSIAEGILRMMITRLIEATGLVKKLEKVFDDLGKKVGVILDGIGAALGKIFGKKGVVDKTSDLVAGLFPDKSSGGYFPGMGGGGGGGGGAGSAAMSGAMGWANLATGAVQAVSAVIGNFQMAHMNTALGRIEESTRYSQIHLGYILDKLNEYIPRLGDLAWLGTIDVRLMAILGVGEESREILRSIRESISSAMRPSSVSAPAFAGDGGLAGGLVVNVYGTVIGSGGWTELTDKLISDLRKRGAIK